MTRRRYRHACSVVTLGTLGDVILVTGGIIREVDNLTPQAVAKDFEYVPLALIRDHLNLGPADPLGVWTRVPNLELPFTGGKVTRMVNWGDDVLLAQANHLWLYLLHPGNMTLTRMDNVGGTYSKTYEYRTTAADKSFFKQCP